MSSLAGTARANTFNESFVNENDQDANSLLTELDKGLRSAKIGDQCEAIVRYPKLFEKYPFPILINSSFLKLAEFFRNGTNLLRIWILRVFQQSEKHLDKILNVDEFVKRIFIVMHSNDPIARALTLRTLGAVAGAIPEKQQVHHAIRRSLDSHDMVEVEAAIHASFFFAAQSKTFAISMCSKVGSMIESLQTPIAMKLQLIPVLRHMHHDANTAALVKTLCVKLLPKYPSENFVIAIFESLTQLSCKTLIDIPDHVTLLLQYLQDPRKRVRYQILRSMKSLAEKGAHLWPKCTLKSLMSHVLTCNDVGREQSLVLSVVLTLTNCPVTCNSLINEEQQNVLELCSTCLVLEHHGAASQSINILTNLITYCYLEKLIPPESYMEQIQLHLESLVFCSSTNENLITPFSNYLKCGVKLSEKNIEFGVYFVELIGCMLTDEFLYPIKHFILMCEALGALCAQFCNNRFSITKSSVPITSDIDMETIPQPSTSTAGGGDTSTTGADPNNREDGTDQNVKKSSNPFLTLLPKLLYRLGTIVDSDFDKEDVHFIEILSAVCLQAMLGYFMPKTVLDLFDKVLNKTNLWTQYRIARSASRFGQHYFATKIYLRLSGRVSIEKMYFFFTSLSQISKAECILNHGLEYENIAENYDALTKRDPSAIKNLLTLSERLDKAINLYWKALATLKASSSPTQPFTFQTEFIRLRGQFLEALFNIVIIKNTQSITPAPAIAQTLAQNSRDHLQKFGHVTNQLRKAVKTLKVCEDLYGKLYKSSFDADPCTLEYLEISQHACSLLGHSIETICFVLPSDSPNMPTDGNYPETKYLIKCLKLVKNELEHLPIEQGNAKTITTQHTDVILTQIEILTKSPKCMPRFFFQILQNTSIKLSVCPQPRVAGDPVIVQPGSNLVIKVEGVIQHYGKIPNLYRSIDSIQLTITSQLQQSKQQAVNEFNKPLNNDTVTLTQTVKPHRDFLSGNFLLPLNNFQYVTSGTGSNIVGSTVSMGGQWQVTLDTCVIDSNNVLWNTGPRSTLHVRVPDDPSKQNVAASTSGARRF